MPALFKRLRWSAASLRQRSIARVEKVIFTAVRSELGNRAPHHLIRSEVGRCFFYETLVGVEPIDAALSVPELVLIRGACGIYYSLSSAANISVVNMRGPTSHDTYAL